MEILNTVEYMGGLKNIICHCAFDIQQFFFFSDITGKPVSSGVSLRNWFVYVKAGKGYAVVERKKYPLIKGSFVFLCPGVEFCIYPESEQFLSYYAIGFMYKNVFCTEEGDNKLNNYYYHMTANIIKIENALETMYRYSLYGDIKGNPGLKCSFYNLLVGIWEDIRTGLDNISIYKRIEKITDYIYNSYFEKINIGDLAEKCSISKEYFIRAFKNCTGSSPVWFINNVRINKAKELLLAETFKIKEIAHLVGIDDEVYFSKLFKKVTGISPKFYISENIY